MRELVAKLPEQWRFLQGWMADPLKVGAISPSGPDLARRMASFVDPGRPGSVVELGPGTGPVTRGLIERGVDPSRLIAIEYSPDFAGLLRAAFPLVTIVEGDAYALDRTLTGHLDGPVSAVVSSLPLLTRPPAERRALLTRVLDLVEPGGVFVQFSYGLKAPVAPEPGRERLDITGWIWRNMPPARVFVYRRL